MTTLALTGITGFIGSNLFPALQEQGFSLRVLIRNPEKAAYYRSLGMEVVHGDLHDADSLDRLLENCEGIAHCAANVRGASREIFDTTNVEPVRTLIELGKKHGIQRFFFMSSLAAREPTLSWYAESKYRAEQCLKKSADPMTWLILRPPPVYGPGDKEMRPLFQTMARGLACLPAGEARVSLIHVDDLVNAIVSWFIDQSPKSGLFELHDGINGGYRWQDVIDIIASLHHRKIHRIAVPETLLRLVGRINLTVASVWGYNPMLTPGKVKEIFHPDWVCDNERLQEILNWQPRITLKEGLKKTFQW